MKEGQRKGEVTGPGKHVHTFLDAKTYKQLADLADFSGSEMGALLLVIVQDYVRKNYTRENLRNLVDKRFKA